MGPSFVHDDEPLEEHSKFLKHIRFGDLYDTQEPHCTKSRVSPICLANTAGIVFHSAYTMLDLSFKRETHSEL